VDDVDLSSTGTHYPVGGIFQMLPYRSYTALLKLKSMSITAISFMTDISTSDVSPMSIMSLTTQWVDEDFVLRKGVLHAQECTGSHTAAAISMALKHEHS
jgi:hypothetical protein